MRLRKHGGSFLQRLGYRHTRQLFGIYGKGKEQKTFNVSAILAAALTNGEVLRYIAEFPDDKRNVLYFDTEQSPHHCQRVMKRALQLAGLSLDSHPDNLFFAQLRALTPDIRLELIDNAIATTPNVGLVIIDGIRDLMFDINNSIESSRLINKLMEWTDKYQIHIHTVLHLNKSDDNVRGHVGTRSLTTRQKRCYRSAKARLTAMLPRYRHPVSALWTSRHSRSVSMNTVCRR